MATCKPTLALDVDTAFDLRIEPLHRPLRGAACGLYYNPRRLAEMSLLEVRPMRVRRTDGKSEYFFDSDVPFFGKVSIFANYAALAYPIWLSFTA